MPPSMPSSQNVPQEGMRDDESAVWMYRNPICGTYVCKRLSKFMTFNSVKNNCPHLVVTAQLFVWTTIPTAVLPARSTRLLTTKPTPDQLYHRWSTTIAGQSFFHFHLSHSVSRHKFWHRHEKRNSKGIPISPHNLSM